MNYTLITGASKGIGKAIAVEAANRGMNLVLVARSRDLLKKLSAELELKKVSVKILVADLFEEDAHEKVFAYVRDNSLKVNMLVNNAGMGFYGNFIDSPLQKHLEIMKLNMDVCIKMTYQFLKNTDANQRRYILNTVSTGAYQPVPTMAIYTASKSFMLSFSRALRFELIKQNVFVTALCPGPTESEFFGPAQMTELVARNTQFMMEASQVARVGFNALMKNKSVAIPGLINKIGAVASKLAPHDLVVSVAGNIYKV
jgi:short-subunit dehydrogenase